MTDEFKGGVHFVKASEQLAKEFPDFTLDKIDDSKFCGFVTDEIDLKKVGPEIKKMYERLDERPLKYMKTSCFAPMYIEIDWSKKPDYTGRVIYWVAPFKYKTAGFDHQMIHSDFGFAWRLWGYFGINLKDLPIDYNFAMAKRFYTNTIKDIYKIFFDKMNNIIKRYINSTYGIGLERSIPKVDLLSIDIDDIMNLTLSPRMPGKTRIR